MQNYIHETVLRDIVELLHDAKNLDSLEMYMKRNRSMKSLSSSASGLVMVYPVITSNSLRIENAQLITKAIERKAVSMLRMVFSAMQFNNSDDVKDYLFYFHVNLHIDNDLSVDNTRDTIDKYVIIESAVKAGAVFINRNDYKKILESDMKKDSILPESISETGINDFKFTSVRGHVMVVQEAPKRAYGGYYDDDEKFQYQQDRDDELDSYNRAKDNRNAFIDAQKHNLNVAKAQSSDTNNNYLNLQKNLLDNDVRKANELVETQMLIQIHNKLEDGSTTVINAIIGIKAKMHPLDSIDVVERIYTKNKDNNFFMKLIQATTREISFFSDFLFAIDKAKIDALSVSKRNRKSSDLWKVLERRAKKSKFKRLAGLKNDAMAISTLVVSQEEVEYLKKEYNIDVEDPSVIRPIIEAYNLMAFVIVDETTEVAKFIFDTGQDMYEHLSFNSLERESSDNSYKKMIKLLNKSGAI